MFKKIKEFLKLLKRVNRLKKIYPGCEVVVNKESKKIFIVKNENVTDKKAMKEIIKRHFIERDY